MTYCSNCGHELGVGRYCTNCGLPVGPAPVDPPPAPPAPRIPPPAPAGAAEPAPPRFPMFADEVEPTVVAPYDEVAEPTQHGQPRRWPIWLSIAAVLLLVAALGFKLLSDDEPSDQSADGASDSSQTPGRKHGAGKHQSDDPAVSAPGDVTADARLEVPATAPAGEDIEGNQVDYDATNMVDGVPETTWRMTGDGTGSEITITLPAETAMRSVGLINGYAKTVEGANGGEIDWYHGNRRIDQVEWVFDDGTTVPQTLGDTTGVQTIDVEATTRTIVLRLVAVSPPGKGPSSRNYTAISDLQLISAG